MVDDPEKQTVSENVHTMLYCLSFVGKTNQPAIFCVRHLKRTIVFASKTASSEILLIAAFSPLSISFKS